jgi:hypothetical protein
MMSVENKRIKIKTQAEEVLQDYPDIKGLEDVFESIWSLEDNANFKFLITSFKKIMEHFYGSDYHILNASESFIREIPQISYSKEILFLNRFKYLIPVRFRDVVGIYEYDALIEIIFVFFDFNNEKITPSNVFGLSNKVIKLLNEFDMDIYFENPDKEYFMKLKALKWDKKAKKLFNKIDKYHDKFRQTCIEEVFDENPDDGYPIMWGFGADVWRCWIFLSGCSAVNNDREVMVVDDVVCACKTYFKLLGLLNKN